MLVKLPKLLKILDDRPFEVMDIRPELINWNRVRAAEYLDEGDRDTDARIWDYDIPRIKYFYNMFKRGDIPEPIDLEWYENDLLSLCNGYHRLAGAILAKSPVIDADGNDEVCDRLEVIKSRNIYRRAA